MNYWQMIAAEAADAELALVLGWLAACWALTRAFAGAAPKARSTRTLFALYAGMIPVAGLLRGQNAAAYGPAHGAILLFGAEACMLSAAALVFEGVLRRLRVSVPRMAQDVAVGGVAVLTAIAVASRAGVDLSGLLTTSAVLTAVIGFGMQDALGNITGGLFLQLDNSVSVGDRVRIGELVGKVVDIRWRHTAVETASGETAIIPNSELMKSQVTVIGRRAAGAKMQRRAIHFNVDFRRPPTQVIDAVSAALVGRKIANVAEDPAPTVLLTDFGDSSARYAARYWLTDLAAGVLTDSAVRSIIFFALRRAGLSLAIPATADFVIERTEEAKAAEVEAEAKARRTALEQVELFGGLSDAERQELADGLHEAPFARGEVITRQDSEAKARSLARDKKDLLSSIRRFFNLPA